MDRAILYDIIYALAAKDGREKELFGNSAAAVREAFGRSLAGDGFPELWFEFPLAGRPWLDFHALTSYKEVAGTQATFAGHDGVYANALDWFARQEPNTVRQLALSYDTSTGNVDSPAVQLLVNNDDRAVPAAFLKAAGRADLCGAYAGFVNRMPPEWYACYVGVFPGRDAAQADSWLRMECIVGDRCQRAYAEDAAILREQLAHVGLEDIGESAIDGIRELACSPFPLELQFNVKTDGSALPVLSASVRFQPQDWSDAASCVEIAQLARWMQGRGLADDRCGRLAEIRYAKRVARADEAFTISCFPAFVKLRWREGHAPEAKSYLVAQASQASAD